MKHKLKSKKTLVLAETHYKELHSGTNNKPIFNPYLPDREKLIEPLGFVEPDAEEEGEELFEEGELSYAGRVSKLEALIKRKKICFEWDRHEWMWEVKLVKNAIEWPRYIYVDGDTNDYCFAIWREEYEVIFQSNSIAEMAVFISSMNFKKRGNGI